MTIALPITKIADPTITDIVLTPTVGWADDLFGDGIWGDIDRGELPNLVDYDPATTLDDLVYRGGTLSFLFDQSPYYLFTGDGTVPWYASDGENVRFEQDESGTYLALSGESSETWISLDVIEAGASVTAEATFDVLYDDWDFLYYEASFSTSLSEDLSADFNDILTSVALSGSDVFGTDGDDVLYLDASDFYVYDFGTDLSATYALGDGSDTYDLWLIETPDSFDVTISDTGGDNDTLVLSTIGISDPGDETLDIEWVENAETGEIDLVLTNAFPGFPGITPAVITVAGQGSNPDARIENFDLGGFGTYTADELLEAFPIPDVETTFFDTDDSEDWTSYTEVRTVDGEMVSRDMLLDDGRTILTEFEGGVRSSVSFEDGEDAFGWTSMTKTYGPDGKTVTAQSKVMDDGRTEEMSIDPVTGAKTTSVTDGGNAFGWDTTTTVVDADGALQSQTLVLDNGRVTETTYTDGARSMVEVSDGANAFNWDSITKTYAPDGTLTGETKLFDDGREAVTSYEGGARTETVTTDVDDAYDWLTITTIYDDTGAVDEVIFEDDPEEELLLA